MDNTTKKDIYKAGWMAGFTKHTDYIANPWNGTPSCDAYELWREGYINGNLEAQKLQDK